MRRAVIFLWFGLVCLPLLSKENGKREEAPVLHEKIEVIGKVDLSRSLQSVSVFTVADWQRFGFADMKSLFQLVPGMLVLTSGHPGQFAYSFARGAAVNQQLFLVDGVKIQDPSSSLGSNFTLISPQLLEKIEIVRGPLSSLYGSSAMGGVVNLITRKGDGASASLVGGSHGSLDGGVHFAASRGGFSLALNGSLSTYSDGVSYADKVTDRFIKRGFSLHTAFENQKVRLGFTAMANLVDCGIPFYLGLPTPQRNYDQLNWLLAVPISLKWNHSGGIDLNLSWQRHRYNFEDPQDLWGPFTANRSTVWELEARASFLQLKQLKISGGTDLSLRRASDSTEKNLWSGWNKEAVFSTFLGADLDLNQVLGSLSLRYDKHGSNRGVWSPQLGFSWNIVPRFKLRGSWSRSFRAASLPERLNPIWGNPDLRPEIGRSWEVGIDTYLRTLQLGLCWFSSRYENLIGYSPLTWRFANINQARVSGLEVNGHFSPLEWVTLMAAYTRLHTLDLQYNRRLLRRPNDQLTLILQFTPRRLSIAVEMIYVGKRLDYDELRWNVGEISSHNVFNLSCRFQLRRQLALVGRLSNLGGRLYSEVLGYPAPGRRLALGVEWFSGRQ